MTYAGFCTINEQIKKNHTNPFTIKDVDLEHNLVMFKDTEGYLYTYSLQKFILDVVQYRQTCITNPSAIKSWQGFDR